MRFSLAAPFALVSLSLGACMEADPPPVAHPEPAALEREAARELDDFHAAADAADEARYFAHFARNGVFLGTDATERWNVSAFRAYAHPHFSTGNGWTYVSVRRALSVSPSGDTVWFDEELKNAKLGIARGSGVLVREDGRLRIAQYNLSVPIPNDSMADVVKIIAAGPRPPPPMKLDAIYKEAYEAATVSAGIDPLADAAKALTGAMLEAKRHPDVDTEFWLHNELTWVRWQQGDLSRALGEVDAAGVAIDHSTLPETKRTALRLHELWDRAYLLLDVAMQTPPPNHTKAYEAAIAAKTAYDTLATANHDSDGMAVLDTWFLLHTGKPKEAAAAARRVDIDKDEDLQDLYVLERAFDANGEHAAADAIVARICAGHMYLMKPLLVSQLAREGKKCGAR